MTFKSTAKPLPGAIVKLLRKKWDAGKASGRAGHLDIKRILAEEKANIGATNARSKS